MLASKSITQLRQIAAIAWKNHIGEDDETRRDFLRTNFGVESSKDMDKKALLEYIKYCNSRGQYQIKYFLENAPSNEQIKLMQDLFEVLGYTQEHIINLHRSKYKRSWSGNMLTLTPKEAMGIIVALNKTYKKKYGILYTDVPKRFPVGRAPHLGDTL